MSRWSMVPLREVLHQVVDSHPVRADQTYPTFGVYGFGRGLFRKPPIPGSTIKAEKLYRTKKGQFIYSRLKAFEGAYGVVTDDLDGHFVSNEFPTFDCLKTKLMPEYLAAYFRTPSVWRYAAQHSMGVGARRERLQPEQLLTLQIPLPSLDEQRRLVAKLDDLAARIEEATKLRSQASRESKALFASMLGQDFEQLALKHEPKALGSLTTCITDGPHITPSYVTDGVPFVTVKNMVSGTLDFRNLQYITKQDHLEISKRCRPGRGDVLYSKDGATRGFPCYIDTYIEFNIFVSVALIKPIRDVLDGRYLTHLLSSQWIKQRVTDRSRGDMIPHIVLREIRAFPVPCPPLDQQLKIVAHLDGLRRRHECLLQTQSESEYAIKAMLPSILSQAFQGQLS